MNNYCERCLVASDSERCPRCGKKNLRALRDFDPVFLVEVNIIWAGMVEDILKSSDIPFEKHAMLGAGISTLIGSFADVFEYYVRSVDLIKAQELMVPIDYDQSFSDEDYDEFFGER